MRLKKKIVAFAVLATLAAIPSHNVAFAVTLPDVPPPTGSEAGAQLNQSRAYLEEQARRARLEKEQKEKRDAKAEGEEAAVEKNEALEVSFKLKKINFSASEILAEVELKEIAQPYLGQEVKIVDLYKIVEKINDLYKKKGYIVCRAYLPPQTIVDGAVQIGLIEGKTGEVTVEGNKSTVDKFIKRRIKLKSGEVSNLEELNHSLLWFNGTNDVQLRIRLQAGKEPGTTDYVITAIEPKRQYGYYILDTAGSETTGIWRVGVGYNNSSLFKKRDNLMLSGLLSKGTRSGSFSYSTPIAKSGTRFGVFYSSNDVEIKRGAMKYLHVEGDSSIYGFSLDQPLFVNPSFRLMVGAGYDCLKSKTDFMGIKWVDDEIKHTNINFKFTHYGKNSLLYHEHSYTHGSWDNIDGNSKSYGRYRLNLLGQKLLKKRQMFTLKMAAQLTGRDYISSSDQFYIGGVNSVRGYKENILSGEKGYSLNLEYNVPDRPDSEWIYFIDYGSVSGASAYGDSSLWGFGAGYRKKFKGNITGMLLLGIPTKQEINSVDQSRARLHLSVFGTF